MPTISYQPHSATHSFSPLIIDYLANAAALKEFYVYRPNDDGLTAAIKARKDFPVDRVALHQVLSEQYENLMNINLVSENIELLKDEQTYTVCTAHQPNILTGHLYSIYKILHTVKLSKRLKSQHPQQNFVPIFYIGSEDNDLEELGQFFYDEKKYVWDGAGQKGAVGRMRSKNFEKIWEQLYRYLGPPSEELDAIKELLEMAYNPANTIAKATQILVHELMGKFGIVCLDPDDARLKSAYKEILWNDLTEHIPAKLVTEQSRKLAETYNSQAFVRPINLFYLKGAIRERIEEETSVWKVINTDISFTKDELKQELAAYPERFSPNVILRGMYQESILPNVAFIGGGSEVAYFFQLKTLFQHFKVFYPPVILRQSLSWLEKSAQLQQSKLDLYDAELFERVDELLERKIEVSAQQSLVDELVSLNDLEVRVVDKATNMDSTLSASAAAHLTRMRKQLERLDHKMFKALKKQHATLENRLEKMHQAIFPQGHLQERHENFLTYYLQHPESYFDTILEAILPYGEEYGIVKA